MKKLLSLLVMLTLILFPSIASPSPASAVPLPTLDVKYVGNCLKPTVEITISGLGGPLDIYFQNDYGIDLIASNYNFDANKVYDGFYSFSPIVKVEVYATNVGAGPYAEHVIDNGYGAVAPNSYCPTYSPVYDPHIVAPTTPVGSVNVKYAFIQWWRSQ
jgi:hypothetical protein